MITETQTTRYANDLVNAKVTLVPLGNGNYTIQNSTAPGYFNGTTITEGVLKEIQSKGILCMIGESQAQVGKQILFG
jgi:hypothetical protein